MKINGNLVFHTLGDGEIRNAIIERLNGGAGGASLPDHSANAAAAEGRIAYNKDDGLYYYRNASAWVSIATGGNATSIQTEVDNIETTIGGMINADGTANTTAMDALANVTGASSLSDVLSQLDQAIEGKDTLAELDDTTITSPATNNVLQYSAGGSWVNVTPAALLGTASINDLSDTESGPAASGDVMWFDGTDWQYDQPGSTSGVQAQGDVLDDFNVLGAATAADQFVYSTAAGVFAYGTITGAARNLLDDATVADMRTTLDVYDTAAADSKFVDVAGDTMTGDLNMGSNLISNVAAPVSGTDAANKNYVDNVAAGLTWKNSVVAATTSNVDLATGGLLTVDGVTVADGDRVLVMNQTNAEDNGIYIAGTGAWTRATDMDSLTPIDEINGAAVYVEQGTVHADAGYTVTSQVSTLGTDPIEWTQFNGASAITDGAGLGKSGNELFVNVGAGIGILPSDEVGIDLYNSTTGALILTTDGSARSTVSGSQLHLLLDGTTLTQSATGLKVDAAGITETELATSVAGDGLAGGAGTALSVRVDDSTIEITSDVLNVKDAGITNAKLANSTVTMSDGTNTDDVALGETFTFAGDSVLTPAITANTVTYTFSAGIDALSDVDTSTTAPALDNILTWDGSKWVPADPSVVLDQASIADLADVSAVGSEEGHVLAWDATNNEFDPVRMHYVYDGSTAATSHTVVHNLNQQFCQVTVVDSSNQVIIADSITFDSATQLTVTFNTSIACKVIVTGVKT